MLHEFLSEHREELIGRCLEKVGGRGLPPEGSSELIHGVPLVLEQIVEALRHEMSRALSPGEPGHSSTEMRASKESRRTAALNGKQLFDEGYSVEQLVHCYGDICQSVTELARERNAPVTVDEFHTLNRLLDNAIADAIASFWRYHESVRAQNDQKLHAQIGELAQAQRDLLNTALGALGAIRAGNVGMTGATAALLEDSLLRLRDLVDRSLPQIRLSTGMTSP